MRTCKKCNKKIPSSKRSDAKYCSAKCRNTAEKQRYKAEHPEYVEKQRKSTQVWHDKHAPAKRTGQRAEAKKLGYRSMFEARVVEALHNAGGNAKYEAVKIKYTKPAVKATYTPDLLLSNGIIVECKGRLVASDRKKHILVREQHPELDIRLVFQNADMPLYRGSPTSYGDWATKQGFKWAEGSIPAEWLRELK